jgi:hypothetical protein
LIETPSGNLPQIMRHINGAYFGIGESGVSQASRRVNDKIRKEKSLEEKSGRLKIFECVKNEDPVVFLLRLLIDRSEF